MQGPVQLMQPHASARYRGTQLFGIPSRDHTFTLTYKHQTQVVHLLVPPLRGNEHRLVEPPKQQDGVDDSFSFPAIHGNMRIVRQVRRNQVQVVRPRLACPLWVCNGVSQVAEDGRSDSINLSVPK